MPKSSPKFTSERREEIISACEKLYQTMSFKDITLIEIGNITTFSRTSIYNYFNTKEEIFLAMLQKEYELWIEELREIIAKNKTFRSFGLYKIIASVRKILYPDNTVSIRFIYCFIIGIKRSVLI